MSTTPELPARPFDPSDKDAVLPIIREGVDAQARLADELNDCSREPSKRITIRQAIAMVDYSYLKSYAALDERPEDCFVYELDGVIVGFMRVRTLYRDPPLRSRDGRLIEQFLSIEEINVAAGAQRRGVASGLIQCAEGVARARSCSLIAVRYLENNEASEKLNEKCRITLTKVDVLGGREPRWNGGVSRFKWLA